MPIKHYPEIAAARHMKTVAGPAPKSGATTSGQAPRSEATADPRAEVRPGEPARRENLPRARAADGNSAHRRQRLVALSLVVLTALAVPSLIGLLVLFG